MFPMRTPSSKTAFFEQFVHYKALDVSDGSLFKGQGPDLGFVSNLVGNKSKSLLATAHRYPLYENRGML